MLAGQNPTIIVRAGGSVTVEGWESDRVQVDSHNRWELELAKRAVTEIGRERARAAVGDRVLFDISFNNPFHRSKRALKDIQGEVIDVQLGDGQVRVPQGSRLIVYAGRSSEVRSLQGRVTAIAGHNLLLREVQALAHASAGGDLNISCIRLDGQDFKFEAGRDLRFYVRDLRDAKVMIREAGTYWEAVLGNGQLNVWLKAGGDVTLVTDQEVHAQPPHYLLGNIERPTPATP
jgi:hypothetical protein